MLLYSPEILEYILTYYMPLLPLWSGIILSKVNIDGISTDGNAEVENWFKIVKHCIFKSQNNMRVGDFIRCIFTHIGDRLASFEFAFQPLGHKVFKVKEKVREATNEEESREIWGKRKRKKNSYIHPKICTVDKVFEKLKDSNLAKTKCLPNPLKNINQSAVPKKLR